MIRKINKYFLTVPVNSWQIAQLLGSETNWKILEKLRDAGVNGLTAEEVSEEIDVPRSTVYSILSKLQAADMVESSLRRHPPPWGRPKKGVIYRFGRRPKKVLVENILWGYSEFDEPFLHSLGHALEDLGKDEDELKKKWLSILEKIVSAYQTDDLKELFPQDPIHEECGWSHEGQEFLYAISLALLERILENKDFEEFATKHKFRE